MASLDRETLEAALIGYEQQKLAIDEKIKTLREHLGGQMKPDQPASAKKASTKGGKRTMTAESRERIAAAQKKRWAEFHKKKR